MAGSRRSPLMRDQRRAGDDSSARPSYRPVDRRAGSPSPKPAEKSTGGLRIRGRAAEGSSVSKIESNRRGRTPDRTSKRDSATIRGRSRSNRGERTEGRPRPSRDSRERDRRYSKSPERRNPARYRRRTRSRSPEVDHFDFRDRERRRPASPLPPSRADSFRPRSRPRKSAHSPLQALRGDHYSSNSRIGDSYIPSSRRESRTPSRERRRRISSPARHRSQSRDRRSRFRKTPSTPPTKLRQHPRVRSPRSREEDTSSYRPRPRSRHSSKPQLASPSSPRAQTSSSQRNRPSRHSHPRRERSRDTIMQHSQPHPSTRPIPNFESSNQHRSAYHHHGASRHTRPPRVDTRVPFSPSQQWTPTSSHHGSPVSASPYSQPRGGWGSQSQHYPANVNSHSPPYRQNSYPPQASPQAQYYPTGPQSPYVNTQQAANGYQNQSTRGSHSGHRGNHFTHTPDRRFSGPGQSPVHGPAPSRGRGGHFQNLQWTANSSARGRGDAQVAQGSMRTSSQQAPEFGDDEEENLFRPSKDLQVEDQTEKEMKASVSKESSKISFAIKTKVLPSSNTRPPPDLMQRTKEPSRKDNLGLEVRPQRRDEKKWRDQRQDRGRERSPDTRIETKIMKRKKPKRTLSPTLADSTSVYYRKPGNESVVGSGTYGKVFKAIHVYTKSLAALKKIRMEGEKDGFPVTAVREIKLLQSLKHDNVVSLQEVMVEHNDCFMVFEYLSHDLTGLLNHPSFKLDHAHKKHLGKQLFEGLNYLHKRSVLHRDIKAANILVSNEGQLKLADFGLARFYSKRGKPDYTNRVITIWYRPPELLLGETQYGPAVDIWSAACVMVEIFTRHAIFPGDGGEINQLDKIYNVLGTPTRSEWPGLVDMAWFELLRSTERKVNTFAEKYQDRVPPAAFELLTAMLLYDPNKRPTAGDVLEHPYFTTEEPAPRQAIELRDLSGDWHEFESKALRKENDRKQQEARRAARNEDHEREKAKRKAGAATEDREAKRQRPSSSHAGVESR